MNTATDQKFSVSLQSSSGNKKQATQFFTSERELKVFVYSPESFSAYNISMATAEPSSDILQQTFPSSEENLELVDVPEGLPSELEARGWLNSSRSVLDFWNSEGDSAYDDL